ncbi:PIN domain-containing protein [Inquilinus sp. Marseille-Q2685]|uniref:PIN domain-containing protein n=1 Tax=Inquilinus sp. Marseille-Q2685 TaxID=2866581 RepID=UPI001CE4953E|nr:PIN domain-containing protein [Inquilinus sp. Marseille-Q2685]
MSAEVFLDTNILLYAIARDDPRAATAEALLAAGGMISVQVLNEFTSVARRKLGLSWDEVTEALSAIRALCAPAAPVTVETHEAALRIAERQGVNVYDALIIAAALQAKCRILYSEDMQDGHTIDGLTIRNPFRSEMP